MKNASNPTAGGQPILGCPRLRIQYIHSYNLHLRATKQNKAGSKAYLLGLFFDPEDGGDMFLRNVGWLSIDNTALYPRRQNSS
jgi:hypothetical protein